MFGNIRKKMKALKSQDREYKENLATDKKGRFVLDIKITAKSAYSEFSPASNRKLNPELDNYIDSDNTAALIQPLSLRVHSSELYENADKQAEFIAVLGSHYKSKRHKQYNALRLNLLSSITCFIIGLIVIAASILTRYLADIWEIVNVSIEIFAWVFVWEAVDLYFFARKEIKLRYYRLARIADANIEFLPEEN